MEQIIKKKLARNWFKTLQEIFCQEIEELEGRSNLFKIKNWERGTNSSEGGGQFRILENGKIFEKVGVNFSKVQGKFPKNFRLSTSKLIFLLNLFRQKIPSGPEDRFINLFLLFFKFILIINFSFSFKSLLHFLIFFTIANLLWIPKTGICQFISKVSL